MSRDAIRYRQLRAEFPTMSQKEMKAHLRKLEDLPEHERKIQLKTPTTPVRTYTPLKGISHPYSYVHKPPEKLSVNREAKRFRKFQAQYPHMSQRELKAHLRQLREKSGEPRHKKGIENARSSVHLPPEQLSMTKEAIKSREKHAKFPHMSHREIKEHLRGLREEQQKVNQDTKIPARASKGCTGINSWVRKDGLDYYKGMEIKKNEEDKYLCPFCTRFHPSPRKHLVSVHINKFHVDVSDGYSCDQCEKKFYYYNDLTSHKRTKHEGGWQCEICGMTLGDHSAYHAHKRIKHLGIKPHVCEHCGKRFGTRKDLTIHVRRHTGERPFVCEVCADAFVDKQALKLHLRRKHPEKLVETKEEAKAKPGGEETTPVQ